MHFRNFTQFYRFEIIAERGIIARLSYHTSFGLYEKVDF